MKIFFITLLFFAHLLNANLSYSAAAAVGEDDTVNRVYERFSPDTALYKKVADYLVGIGELEGFMIDIVLTEREAFTQKWNGLKEIQRQRLYDLLFSEEEAAASGGGGSGGASGGAASGAAAVPEEAVRGRLIHPPYAEGGAISKAWFGIEGSHLYKYAGRPTLPRAPLIHEYNSTLSRIYFAGKFAPGQVTVPDFVSSLPGTLKDVYVVVIQTPWEEETLFRPHYAIHTADDQKTPITFHARGADFGDVGVIGANTVEMHTHPGEGHVIASPNAGKFNLAGKKAKDIGSGSFWVVAQIGGEKIATLYWLANDEPLMDTLESMMDHVTTLEGFMAALGERLPGNPQARRIRQLLKYE